MHRSTLSLTWALVGGWMIKATSRPLYPQEWPGTHCIEGWVGPRAGLDGWGKSRLPPEFDPRTAQLIVSRCTVWAILNHKLLKLHIFMKTQIGCVFLLCYNIVNKNHQICKIIWQGNIYIKIYVMLLKIISIFTVVTFTALYVYVCIKIYYIVYVYK